MFRTEKFKAVTQVGTSRHMPIKVLMNEGKELRIRFVEENHTSLQLFRSRLSEHKDVEYANYFIKHPELSGGEYEPEFYVRVKKGDPAKLILSVCDGIATDFENIKL